MLPGDSFTPTSSSSSVPPISTVSSQASVVSPSMPLPPFIARPSGPSVMYPPPAAFQSVWLISGSLKSSLTIVDFDVAGKNGSSAK